MYNWKTKAKFVVYPDSSNAPPKKPKSQQNFIIVTPKLERTTRIMKTEPNLGADKKFYLPSFRERMSTNSKSRAGDSVLSFEKIRHIVEDQATHYKHNSVITNLHDDIVQSIKCMPKEVINSLNINHHHSDFHCDPEEQKTQTSKLLNEWQYELIQSLKKIEDTIVTKLFKGNSYVNSKDFTMKQDVVDPLGNFDLKMIPQILMALNGSVSKGIKLLSLSNTVIATAVENIWKLCTFILDLSMTWSYNRNNSYIQSEIKENIKNLIDAKSCIVGMEDKITTMMRKQTKEMDQERAKYYELHEQFVSLYAKVSEFSKGRDEDIHHIANGGSTYNVGIQKITEMDFTLNQFDKEVTQSAFRLQTGITGVANSLMIHSKLSDRVQYKLRNILGVNPNVQLPGDLAYGNMVSEHPWMSILQLRNISILTFKNKEYHLRQIINRIEQPTKQSILHEFLMQDLDKDVSPTHKLIQQQNDSSFSLLLQSVLNIVLPLTEASPQQIHINQILCRVFNLHDKEGLEIQYFLKLQQYYQTMIKIITSQQKKYQLSIQRQNSAPIENISPGTLFFRKLTQEQIQSYMSIIKTIMDDDKEFMTMQIAFQEITQKELQFSQVLLLFTDTIYRISAQKYKDRVTTFKLKMKFLQNQEDFFKRSVAQVICDDIFPEYPQMDVYQIWYYLINRYYVVFEKQIQYDPSIIYRRILESDLNQSRKSLVNSNITNENIIDQFMVQTLSKIRTILIFNPKQFDSQNKSLLIQSSQYTIHPSEIDTHRDIGIHKKKVSITIKLSPPQDLNALHLMYK